MATLKQFEANRRNSQKSTGPKTPEGKSAVSMNALRHGLRARTVVLPGEDPTEFHQLCNDLESEWIPQSRTEQFYVEQMAVSQWKLTRMEVVEVNIFKDTDAKSQLSMLDRLWQAECRLERSIPERSASCSVFKTPGPLPSNSPKRSPLRRRPRKLHPKSDIRHPKSISQRLSPPLRLPQPQEPTSNIQNPTSNPG
jgi:hypothetical protein